MADVSDNPMISVIVPVYNAEDYVRPMIESLLNQTYRQFEILVVDDGGTDRSAELLSRYAKEPNVHIFHQSNSGVSTARNHALSKASGEWVGFLDADDLWDAEKLAVQVPCIDPDVDIIHANSRVIDGEGRVTREAMNYPDHVGEPTLAQQIVCNRFLLHTALVRTELLRAVGGFDMNNRIGAQDFELWLLLLARGARPRYVNEILAGYRVHGENYSLDRDRNHRGQLFGLEVLKTQYGSRFSSEEKKAWRARVCELNFDTAWHRFHNERFGESMNMFFRAARYGSWPLKCKVTAYMLFCCLPFRRRLFRTLRKTRG